MKKIWEWKTDLRMKKSENEKSANKKNLRMEKSETNYNLVKKKQPLKNCSCQLYHQKRSNCGIVEGKIKKYAQQ